MTDNSQKTPVCPVCKSPVPAGLKFCENCGAKIEQSLLCVHCGAPLTPGVKFCETCGKAVAAPAPEPVVRETPPTQKEPEPPAPATEELAPEPALEEIPKEPEQEPRPAELPASEPVPPISPSTPDVVPATPSAVATSPITEVTSSKSVLQQPAAGAGAGPNKTLIIAGVVGLLVIAAVALFVLLPMLGGAPDGSTTTGQGAATTTVPSVATPASAESFTTLPTEAVPVNLEVVFQAERNPITGLVTVTFSGGPGLNGISETLVRLTKSDGLVVTKSFKPKAMGDSVTLQGTLQTDRLEVITNFYNGDSYRVIDQLFEYKKKN